MDWPKQTEMKIINLGFGLWGLFEIFRLTHMTNGQNSKMKIYEAFLKKKIFEIKMIRMYVAKINQFSIIKAVTEL